MKMITDLGEKLQRIRNKALALALNEITLLTEDEVIEEVYNRRGAFSTIPLRAAKLCLDCETIHTNDYCPKCGSPQWHWLVKIIPSLNKKN